MPDSKITVEIVGDKKNLDKVLGGINSDVNSFGANMVKVGKALSAAIAAGFTAIVAGAAIAVNEYASFENSMNEVFTLLPGISGDAMSKMEDQVLSFAREMNVLPDEIVPALYQSLSAGVPAGNVFEFLETSVKLSKGGVTDLETAVDGLSSVVNAYGDEIISAEEASDIMFTTVRLGKTTVGELAGSLSNVTPIAATLGVNFGDVGAALAALTAQGTPTAEATTKLRQLLVELSDSGTDVGAQFERIAGQSFPDFIASGGDLGDAMAIIQQISEDTGIPVQQLFSSIEAGSAAAQLTGRGLEVLQGNIDAMGDSAGATEAAYEQMKKGLSESFASLQAELAVVAIEVGRELAPAVSDLAQLVEENSEEIANAIMAIVEGTVAFIDEAVRQLSDFMSALDSSTQEGSKALRDFKSDTATETEEMTSDWGRMLEAIRELSFGEILGLLVRDLSEVSDAEREFTNQIADGMGVAAKAILEFTRFTINAFAEWAEFTLDSFILAFGWVPGLGDKLRTARDAVRDFRDNANEFLDGLVDQVDIFFEGHDNVSPVVDNMLPKIRELQEEIYATYPGGTPSLDPQAGAPPISTGPGGSGGISVFDAGGVVPGALGAPQMALVHGGETVLPTHKMSAEAAIRHVGLTRDDIAFGTAAGMQLAGVAGQQTNIGPVTVNAKSTDPDEVRRVLVEEHRRKQLLGAG